VRNILLRTVPFIALSLFLTAAFAAQDKTSDPSGVWYGDYGTSSQSRTEIRIVFKWDGKALTGTVATEDGQLDLENARFDPATGAVHMEVVFQGRGAPGRANTYRYIADGKMENNTISGTWHNEFDKGDFAVNRIS
jgi:hypothetical protein